ncbi:MAG: alpha/beta hydrolase [Pseudomonadota bacterium]
MAYLQTTCGRQIYFEDYRRAATTGPVMFLVHGWGMSTQCWDPILADLHTSGLGIVAIDHRGCGRSDKTFDDMSIGAIADDIVALLDHLEIDRAILNGWSLGGAVVVDAAAKLGSRCSGLVLTGGATPVYTQKPDFEHGGTADDVAGTVLAYHTNRIDFLQGLSQAVCVKEVGANVEKWFYQIFLQASPLAGATLGELATSDQREMLLGLDVPIVSIFGSEDGFVAPAICRWVGEQHPRARNVEFAGVGHAPFIEAREEYLVALNEFVGEIG